YDGTTPRVAISSISKDDFAKKRWSAWSMPQAISDPGIPNKDACIIPEKFDDGYVFLHRVENAVCADILPDLDFSKRKINRCIEILSPRKGMWDSKKVGIAAPPIKTKAGWLLFYHGISESMTYRVGAALLDLEHPIIVKARTATPIFEPQEDYELKGVMPRVVFPCGIVRRGDTIYMYYGAADSTVCLATGKLSRILASLSAS
ncbi:MAG: glycosidase, partial [Candidatus Paceibacterota bacterium]